ncbi:MAG: acyl transferase, partial [Gammaproteobacteria bacterium]|nr:acyl transferase [Gammaproteobacteria bacterium]
PRDYTIIGLLPNYLENKSSSLIYMVNKLIQKSSCNESGFYLEKYEGLIYKLLKLENLGKKIILIGVSYALLDLIEVKKIKLKNTIIIETGGMKEPKFKG